jgi:aerotolerance regulator-like protein
MTFLNPLFLIALAAAAIPIILHLLNLRKTRVVEFSTLTFLKELQRSKIRKLKIRQWLLLVLRTLIIVFLVLAFTRPALRSAFGFLPGTDAKSSVVIVVDNSISLLASDENGQLLKQAKEKAIEILDMLSPGDEAVLMTTSQPNLSELEFTAALNAVRKEIMALESSPVHRDYREVFTAVSVVLDQSNNLNKEIYLISDDQHSQYLSDDENAATEMFSNNAKLLVFPLGSRAPVNATVSNVEIQNAFFETNKPVDLTATIANESDRQLNTAAVSVFLNGERVMQKTADIDANASRTLNFSVIPKNDGLIEGFIELEADDIPEDNRRYFSFSIPEKIRVLLGPSGSKQSLLLKLALQPGQESSDDGGLYRIDELSAAALRSANFTNYDIVILTASTESVSESFLNRLTAYVRGGGGLMLFPDADGKIDAFRQKVLPAFGLPVPGGTRGKIGSLQRSASFGTIDFDHPLFRNVFAQANSDDKPTIESPGLFYSVALSPANESQTVIATSNGDGFLIDQHFGSGKVLVYASALDFQWTDFPIKGVFVPLMNRSVLYLASTEYKASGGIAGESFEVQLPASSASGQIYDVLTPGGESIRLVPRSLMTGKWFTIERPQQTGVYTISVDGKPAWKFPVNLDPAESDAEKITESDRDDFLTGIGISEYEVLDSNADILSAVAEIRYGVELWKYFIILALLCALAEMLIARDAKRRMAGLDDKK